MASVNLRRLFISNNLRSKFLRLWQPYYQCTNIKKFHTTVINDVQGLPIKMPSLSPTMVEGTIVKWLKKEGDIIEPGDILCEIQTDKAVVALETDEEGIFAKILIAEDIKDVKVGTLIALFVDAGEDWKNVEAPPDELPLTKEPDSEAIIQDSSTTPKMQETSQNFGPSVRILLEKYGITNTQVPANGPHGKLLKGDILSFIAEKNIQPKTLENVASPTSVTGSQTVPSPTKVVSNGQYDEIELTNMRKTIAKRLSQSKFTIAHTYSTFECSLNNLVTLRKQFKSDGVSVSVNDFVIKATSVALTRCPDINSVWKDGQLVRNSTVDMSVAVATDAGLITPIVKGADSLGLEEISSRVRDLAARARQNKLKLDEFQGGTFTISNLGMFGIKQFTAIINQPQCAILAVGGGFVSLGEKGSPETRMRATLSYDQSAISDDSAANFLEILKDLLENPQQILVGSYAKSFDHPMASLL